jgi:Spy/CpxP family protein refolding chaperone
MLPTSKIQAIGLLVAVAALGFAAGIFTRTSAATPAPIDWRERCSYSGMLHDRLGLSDVQRDSIRALMRAQRPAMRALMAPMQSQMDSMRTGMREKVRAVLTPEQRLRYDSLLTREREERFRGDSARGNPPGGR